MCSLFDIIFCCAFVKLYKIQIFSIRYYYYLILEFVSRRWQIIWYCFTGNERQVSKYYQISLIELCIEKIELCLNSTLAEYANLENVEALVELSYLFKQINSTTKVGTNQCLVLIICLLHSLCFTKLQINWINYLKFKLSFGNSRYLPIRVAHSWCPRWWWKSTRNKNFGGPMDVLPYNFVWKSLASI